MIAHHRYFLISFLAGRATRDAGNATVGHATRTVSKYQITYLLLLLHDSSGLLTTRDCGYTRQHKSINKLSFLNRNKFVTSSCSFVTIFYVADRTVLIMHVD